MQTTVVPYCGEAPDPTGILARWNVDPALIAIIMVAFICFRTRYPRSRWLLGSFVVALVLFVSPLCALSSALFSMRVTHHLVLTALLAPMLTLALPRSEGGSVVRWALAHAAVFWAWHAPAAYALALASVPAYWLMQLTLLGSALGFWRAVRVAPPPAAVGALLATMVQMGMLGALLTFAATPLYAWHATTTQPWGLTPLEDQQLAGLLMWVPGAGIYLAAALLLTHRWLGERQQPALT